MLPTPSTSHVNYDRVYEPAEDSYLLLDALSSTSEIEFLSAKFPDDTPCSVVLEVGTGSGVVLAFVTANAGHIFGRSDIVALGVDVNSYACTATRQTVERAIAEAARDRRTSGLFVDTLNMDLTSAMKPASVDVLVFNPPYVPSETLPSMSESELEDLSQDTFARDSHLLSLSTDGGADGMETTNRLLSELPSVLSERGVAYILFCAQNKPEKVMATIRSWPGGWLAEKVASSGKSAGWERLCVIRISRSGHPSER